MRYYFWGLLLIIVVSSCHNGNGLNKNEGYQTNKNLPQLRNEWAREYEAWKKLDIQNYQFIYSLSNYGRGWGLRIVVKNGQFHEAIDIKTENRTEGWEFTIDDVFKSINNAFDRDEKKEYDAVNGQISTSFYVRYNPEYHFPEEHSIVQNYKDYYKHGGNWVETIIKDFVIIEE